MGLGTTIGLIFGVGCLLVVGYAFVRGGSQMRKRDESLRRFAESNGLRYRKHPSPHAFTATGTLAGVEVTVRFAQEDPSVLSDELRRPLLELGTDLRGQVSLHTGPEVELEYRVGMDDEEFDAGHLSRMLDAVRRAAAS